MYVHTYVCHDTHVEVSRQLSGAGSLLAPWGFPGLNSGCQVWQQCSYQLSHPAAHPPPPLQGCEVSTSPWDPRLSRPSPSSQNTAYLPPSLHKQSGLTEGQCLQCLDKDGGECLLPAGATEKPACPGLQCWEWGRKDASAPCRIQTPLGMWLWARIPLDKKG